MDLRIESRVEANLASGSPSLGLLLQVENWRLFAGTSLSVQWTMCPCGTASERKHGALKDSRAMF